MQQVVSWSLNIFRELQDALLHILAVPICEIYNAVENMERCLEDLINRMIYLMTCRKGLSIYPLLLFVVVINKEQSHHRIKGCWLQSP
jgi:hypothetical protein